jgi:hypothetical protein
VKRDPEHVQDLVEQKQKKAAELRLQRMEDRTRNLREKWSKINERRALQDYEQRSKLLGLIEDKLERAAEVRTNACP